MVSPLQSFERQFVGVLVATLLPVLVISFLLLAFTPGEHAGASRPAANATVLRRMT